MILGAAVAVVAALAHLTLVVALVVGGPLVLRRPRLVWAHLAAAAGTAAVFLAGADCPFTRAELWGRRRAGWSTYEQGFISHYLVEPIHHAGITPTVRVVIMATWLVPTVVAYAVLLRRRLTRSTPLPAT